MGWVSFASRMALRGPSMGLRRDGTQDDCSLSELARSLVMIREPLGNPDFWVVGGEGTFPVDFGSAPCPGGSNLLERKCRSGGVLFESFEIVKLPFEHEVELFLISNL